MTQAHRITIPSLPDGVNILMLATGGCDWFVATSAGLFRSTDGGKSWADVLVNAGINRELIVPAVATSPVYCQDQTVFAGVAGGILRSLDGGNTWALAQTPKPEPVVGTLMFSPDFGQDGRLFAGTVEDGVLCSNDRGTTWAFWNFQLVDLSIQSLAIPPDFMLSGVLYAGTSTGIFGSRTAGRSWYEIELPCGYAAVVNLVALPGGVLLAATEQVGLFRSVDGGQRWQKVGTPAATSVVALEIGTGGVLAASTGTGLLLSVDAGLTWHEASLQLPDDVGISALTPLETGWLVALSDNTVEVVQ